MRSLLFHRRSAALRFILKFGSFLSVSLLPVSLFKQLATFFLPFNSSHFIMADAPEIMANTPEIMADAPEIMADARKVMADRTISSFLAAFDNNPKGVAAFYVPFEVLAHNQYWKSIIDIVYGAADVLPRISAKGHVVVVISPGNAREMIEYDLFSKYSTALFGNNGIDRYESTYLQHPRVEFPDFDDCNHYLERRNSPKLVAKPMGHFAFIELEGEKSTSIQNFVGLAVRKVKDPIEGRLFKMILKDEGIWIVPTNAIRPLDAFHDYLGKYGKSIVAHVAVGMKEDKFALAEIAQRKHSIILPIGPNEPAEEKEGLIYVKTKKKAMKMLTQIVSVLPDRDTVQSKGT